MFSNYLKLTIRNLVNNKIYTFINIFGLAVGVSCFILIVLFVKDEMTYDNFNKNAERIFRVNAHYKIGENRFNMANSPVPLGNVLVDEYPEIEKSVRLTNRETIYIKKGEEYIKELEFFFADSTMFEIFTVEFIEGNYKTALTQPNSVIITDEMAEKYFANKNPMGNRLILSNGMEMLVTGVVKPFPKNSHIEFDFLASYKSLPESSEIHWFGTFVHTYVLTNRVVSEKELNDKIFQVTEKHVGPIIKGAFGVSYHEFINNGNDFSFVFVPLKKIHLYSKVYNEFKETGNINTIYIFSAIAVFILLIACINFINLATAKSSKRANEVGVRKVLGSNKGQLIKQFLSESIILCFIAVLISSMIVEIALPYFNELTQKKLSMDYFGNNSTLILMLIFTLVLGFVSGIFPSIILASFKPVAVLKGKIFRNTKKSTLRRGLVVFQFTTSIVLFISTFIIFNQMEYMKNKNLGYNKDQVLVVQNVSDLGEQQTAFVNSLKNNSDIINASLSWGLPVHNLSANVYRKEKESNISHTLVTIEVDYNYLDTYKLKMKSGRFFSEEISGDTLGIILNEAAVNKLDYNDPINEKLLLNTGEEASKPKLTIIGVVKDFNIQSLKDEIRPAALVLLNSHKANFLSVKLSTKQIKNSIKYISDKWKEFGQSKPLEYTFFDESFDDMYRSEIQAGQVFTVFAVLAIIIACLGLFGLAAFTAEQRTKEIGIRKVLGSSISQIILLLSKEFAKWVIISNIIAWPIAYFIMNKWLEEFVYRIEINLLYFLLAGLLTVIIAMITISFQSIKAAVANPIKSLRYE